MTQEQRTLINKRHRDKYNKKYKSIRLSVATYDLIAELRGDMSINSFVRQLLNEAKGK